MSIYPTKSYPIIKGLSEFEILKASHKYVINTFFNTTEFSQPYTHTHLYIYLFKKGFFAKTRTKAKTKITRTEEKKMMMMKKKKKKGG